MRSFDPATLSHKDRHQTLVGMVSPRPIAFVSTISEDGISNLAPYSFFNVFGSTPPVLAFSVVQRPSDGSFKDTYTNIVKNREAVVNVVSYDILHPMTLASLNYPADVDEFDKSGLTPLPSTIVQPMRVKESPAQFECKVRDIYPLGDQGGAGYMIICDIVFMHLSKHIYDEDGKIDPQRADIMGRNGRAFYTRAKGENVWPVFRPPYKIGMGVDQLPSYIRESHVLTGNDLAQLAAAEAMPAIDPAIQTDPEVMNAVAGNIQDREQRLHLHAQALIAQGQIEKAWQVLLIE
ncbi:MAG: flavin reductase family protein [Bacteroidota bacterium]